MADSIQKNFYDIQADSPNPIRRWWHRGRRELIHGLVDKYYRGGRIVDLGCGNCTWNYNCQYDVIGVDINENALEYCLTEGRIISYICNKVTSTGLRDGYSDLLVSSEVMEHIPDTVAYLDEVKRLLSKDGIFILTLPYDTNLSLWRPLFALQCFWQGSIKGDTYYKNRCGHIHHYNKRKLQNKVFSHGFAIKEIGVFNLMTLFCVMEKA